MAAWFADYEPLKSGESLRDDVWSFIGVVLAPDVVDWRFGAARDRYLGGVRNTFQRLWLRARAFDRGREDNDRWRLLEELTEDALVQITERPSLGNDVVISCAIAEAWVRAAQRYGRGAMQSLMRDAAIKIRILSFVRDLSSISSTELASLLDGVFESLERTTSSLVEFEIENLNDAEKILREEQGLAVIEAATRLREEARSLGVLSPKSESALEAISMSRFELSSSEKNAVRFLLGRLQEKGVFAVEVKDFCAINDLL
ncbi:hypothetical protein D3C77_440180 [compost metagenome]